MDRSASQSEADHAVRVLRRDNEPQATQMAALEQQVAVLAKAMGSGGERPDGCFRETKTDQKFEQPPRPRAGVSVSWQTPQK